MTSSAVTAACRQTLVPWKIAASSRSPPCSQLSRKLPPSESEHQRHACRPAREASELDGRHDLRMVIGRYDLWELTRMSLPQ